MNNHQGQTIFKYTIPLALILLGLLLVVQPLQATPPIAGPGRAWDTADAPAYNTTWDNGDDDGTGFGPWALSTTGGNAGHFIGSSTGNGDGDSNADGDININGEAWGMYANSGDVANAVRPFDAALTTGDHFYLQMDNGSIDATHTVGFGLQNSNGANLVEFFFVGGDSNYTLNDAAGATDTGIGFTDEGLALRFDLTGTDTYRLVVTSIATDSSTTFYGTLIDPGTGQDVSQVRLFNANAGNGGGNDAFFNGLRIGASTVEFSDTAVSYGNPTFLSYQVALGDVDNDGDLDAFIGNNNAAGNTVWFNDGSGGYINSGQSLGTNFTNYVALGDLDNDGDLDAFEVNLLNPNRVWVNQGGAQMGTLGTFADSGQSLGVAFPSNEGRTVALGDVDGDGDLDAFVGNGLSASFGNTVYINQGGAQAGTLGMFLDSGQSLGNGGSQAVALGDLDGDGDLDAFVGNNDAAPAARANKVYTNDGAGVFTDSGQNLGDFVTTAVELADLDNDGDLDAFVGNSTTASNTNPANRVWLNDGSGTFSNTLQRLGHSHTFGISLGDLDGDGDIDAYAANNAGTGPGADKIWLNNGSGGIFSDSGLLLGNSNSFGVDLGDLDQDGDLDAYVANNSQANLVWTNEVVHRNAPFDSGVDITTSPNQPRPVVAADMDKDGDLDIVSASFNDDTIAWYENDGAANPTWTASNIANTANGATSVFVADMDNDGDMDILSSSFIDDTIAWYENDGAVDPTFTASNIFTTANGAASVFAADMDGDGDMDILSASQNDGTIAWYENDGAVNPTWTHIVIATSANGARSIFAADMDNDGDMDILSASREDDTIAWYENNGAANPTFTASDIATSADGAASVFAADMDSDGDMDILSASEFDDTIAWYENDGAANPAWAASDIVTTADGAFTVFAADMDNDGDMDILSASQYDNTIAWYENDGATDPTFTASDITTTATGAFFVSAADMDNDGDMDVLSTASSANTIAWHENEGGSAGFVVTDTSISSGFIADGTEDDVMRVVFTHNGVSGDHDLELDYWNVNLLASDCSTALTTAAVDANLAALRVRVDDGDDTFETDGSDVIVGSVSAGGFNLDGNGTQQIPFANDDANVQVSGTTSKTYWLSFEAPVDEDQLGICVRLDPDADMLVEGKTPDFSVSIQDSDPTTTTNTPTAVSLQFVGTPAPTNGATIALMAMGTLLLTLGALWVRRRMG